MKEHNYRIHARGRTFYFATLEEAKEAAERVFQKSGIVLGIEKV